MSPGNAPQPGSWTINPGTWTVTRADSGDKQGRTAPPSQNGSPGTPELSRLTTPTAKKRPDWTTSAGIADWLISSRNRIPVKNTEVTAFVMDRGTDVLTSPRSEEHTSEL